MKPLRLLESSVVQVTIKSLPIAQRQPRQRLNKRYLLSIHLRVLRRVIKSITVRTCAFSNAIQLASDLAKKIQSAIKCCLPSTHNGVIKF
jgi:hypothetical protein